MKDEISDDVDLFGNPWRAPKDRRGRKSHRWNDEVSETVGVLRGHGHTKEQIADYVGLDPKTLDKYYSRELSEGPSLAKAQVDLEMYRKARSGNVAAARYCREGFDQGKAKRIAAPVRAAAAPKPGKKEERQRAANNVSGRFSTPAAPVKERMQ